MPRGPAKTPTEILKLHGSRRADRPREPRPKAEAPACPQWLSAEARLAWRELVPKLIALKILTAIDRNALARYCTLWARWRKLSIVLEKTAETYPLLNDQGQIRCWQQRPEVSIVNQLSQLLLRLEQEFGLTPAARPRIDAGPKDQPQDPLQALLNRQQKVTG
jgi:P27 family predicted phage terminase small subunit